MYELTYIRRDSFFMMELWLDWRLPPGNDGLEKHLQYIRKDGNR